METYYLKLNKRRSSRFFLKTLAITRFQRRTNIYKQIFTQNSSKSPFFCVDETIIIGLFHVKHKNLSFKIDVPRETLLKIHRINV